MVEIEFNYNQKITAIQANLGDIFITAINKFLQKSSLELNSVYFLANGDQITNPQNTVESFMNSEDKKNKKMAILVNKIEKDDNDKSQTNIKSNDIICPDCKEPCRIAMENYKIKLYECINGHIKNNIDINDFENTQTINLSQIICDECKLKNKGNCPKKEFYRCLTCKKNLCILCKPNHNHTHNIILYDQKNYMCQLHNEHLIKYCTKCKKNICFSCQEHKNHKQISFEDLIPDIEEKKKVLNDIKLIMDETNAMIKEIINQLNGLSEFINKYYEINKGILDNYDVKRRNYQVLTNLKEISINNTIFDKLKISNKKDFKNKVFDLIDLYKNISGSNINIKGTPKSDTKRRDSKKTEKSKKFLSIKSKSKGHFDKINAKIETINNDDLLSTKDRVKDISGKRNFPKEKKNKSEKLNNNSNKKEKIKKEKILPPTLMTCFSKGILEKSISQFLTKNEQINLLSCNKSFAKLNINIFLDTIFQYKQLYDISINETIDDKIMNLEKQYSKEILDEPIKKFELNKGSLKALPYLDVELHTNLFKLPVKEEILNELSMIYRIFCQLLGLKDLVEIKSNKIFWKKFSKYILDNKGEKLGQFFIESSKKFIFDDKNILKLKLMTKDINEKILPKYWGKICATTQLFAFMIKDALEYAGVLKEGKTQPSRIKANYLYVKNVIEKLNKFINLLEKK